MQLATSRRDFLRTGVAAGGGLLIGFSLVPKGMAQPLELQGVLHACVERHEGATSARRLHGAGEHSGRDHVAQYVWPRAAWESAWLGVVSARHHGRWHGSSPDALHGFCRPTRATGIGRQRHETEV